MKQLTIETIIEMVDEVFSEEISCQVGDHFGSPSAHIDGREKFLQRLRERLEVATGEEKRYVGMITAGPSVTTFDFEADSEEQAHDHVRSLGQDEQKLQQLRWNIWPDFSCDNMKGFFKHRNDEKYKQVIIKI